MPPKRKAGGEADDENSSSKRQVISNSYKIDYHNGEFIVEENNQLDITDNALKQIAEKMKTSNELRKSANIKIETMKQKIINFIEKETSPEHPEHFSSWCRRTLFNKSKYENDKKHINECINPQIQVWNPENLKLYLKKKILYVIEKYIYCVNDYSEEYDGIWKDYKPRHTTPKEYALLKMIKIHMDNNVYDLECGKDYFNITEDLIMGTIKASILKMDKSPEFKHGDQLDIEKNKLMEKLNTPEEMEKFINETIKIVCEENTPTTSQELFETEGYNLIGGMQKYRIGPDGILTVDLDETTNTNIRQYFGFPSQGKTGLPWYRIFFLLNLLFQWYLIFNTSPTAHFTDVPPVRYQSHDLTEEEIIKLKESLNSTSLEQQIQLSTTSSLVPIQTGVKGNSLVQEFQKMKEEDRKKTKAALEKLYGAIQMKDYANYVDYTLAGAAILLKFFPKTSAMSTVIATLVWQLYNPLAEKMENSTVLSELNTRSLGIPKRIIDSIIDQFNTTKYVYDSQDELQKLLLIPSETKGKIREIVASNVKKAKKCINAEILNRPLCQALITSSTLIDFVTSFIQLAENNPKFIKTAGHIGANIKPFVEEMILDMKRHDTLPQSWSIAILATMDFMLENDFQAIVTNIIGNDGCPEHECIWKNDRLVHSKFNALSILKQNLTPNDYTIVEAFRRSPLLQNISTYTKVMKILSNYTESSFTCSVLKRCDNSTLAVMSNIENLAITDTNQKQNMEFESKAELGLLMNNNNGSIEEAREILTLLHQEPFQSSKELV